MCSTSASDGAFAQAPTQFCDCAVLQAELVALETRSVLGEAELPQAFNRNIAVLADIRLNKRLRAVDLNVDMLPSGR